MHEKPGLACTTGLGVTMTRDCTHDIGILLRKGNPTAKNKK